MKRGTKATGHSKGKVSTVNLKKLVPYYSKFPHCELEYMAADPLNEGKPSLTVWEGTDSENKDGKYEVVVTNSRQLRFELPEIPFKFVLVNGEIYYRRNVE